MGDRVRLLRRGLTALAAAAALSFTGCDWLLESRTGFADNARVRITGTTPVTLLLVTSTNYTAVRDMLTGETVTNLIVADTSFFHALPFDRSFDLRGRDRFLVRLVNPELDSAATVHFLVEIDGRVVYTENAIMRDASLQFISYFDPR